jgi:hypothetical protein
MKNGKMTLFCFVTLHFSDFYKGPIGAILLKSMSYINSDKVELSKSIIDSDFILQTV